MSTSNIEIAEKLGAILHEGWRSVRLRRYNVNESNTLALLIDPVIRTLGFPASHCNYEPSERGNRPDNSLYLEPFTGDETHAAVLIEAKPIETNFDKSVQNQPRFASPDRQIQRYLRQHLSSGPATYGVLTDGTKWRVYQRTNHGDIRFIDQYDFMSIARNGLTRASNRNPEIRQRLIDFVELLSRNSIATATSRALIPEIKNLADELFTTLAEVQHPARILETMMGNPDLTSQSDLTGNPYLYGVRKDAHDEDWESYAYINGPALKSENPELIDDGGVTVAAVKYRYDELHAPSRADVAICAKTFAAADKATNASMICTYTVAPDNTVEARIAVAANNQVNMTVAFDPTLPSPSARTAIDQLLTDIRAPDFSMTTDQLLDPLEVSILREQFYKEVAQWMSKLYLGKTLNQRQAILRHLIRIMFTWILKEADEIPTELFEYAFTDQYLSSSENSYHRDILGFLFHKRLNIPLDKREKHDIDGIESAMQDAPFLNGSIFGVHQDDDSFEVPDEYYWSTDTDQPGIFTILSRYHWTMDEHRPGESEQTLDTELLSNLFERLITPTEEGTSPPDTQPGGTYYTPADVADEMVKDALTAAVKDYAPKTVDESQLLALFSDSDAQLPKMSQQERERLVNRIKSLRVFDPAVGSGEFLFSVLAAMRTALCHFKEDNTPDEIIKNQLAGQDIHPLAVQIARLRLFIAIKSFGNSSRNSKDSSQPLPNLEARIVCADTLETIADPDWRPSHPSQFDSADPDLVKALTALADNRARWFDAHTEQDKEEVLSEDDELRSQLQKLLQEKGDLASEELIAFAHAELLDVSAAAAKTDARLLFYEKGWNGFDIVIGNPPYEALSASIDRDGIKRLKQDKCYKTTNIGNLYSLFCEVALSLASQDGGVATMIVPLSISFGRRQSTLRAKFKKQCSTIKLRHYGNRPDTIFNVSPTVRSPENRQRATIFTAILGNDEESDIETTGLQSWPSDEREDCLTHKSYVLVPELNPNVDHRIAGQWPRIPTVAVAEMIKAITDQQTIIADCRSEEGPEVTFPHSAYHYVSTLPQGWNDPPIQPQSYSSVLTRRERLFPVEDPKTQKLIIATLNGHVAFAWWSVYGDGFDVKTSDLTSMTIPDAWISNPAPAIEIADRLIDAMPKCIDERKFHGKIRKNVDFHSGVPELIEELDKLHIAALGLNEEPLLTHLRIMRSSSTWKYPNA